MSIHIDVSPSGGGDSGPRPGARPARGPEDPRLRVQPLLRVRGPAPDPGAHPRHILPPDLQHDRQTCKQRLMM